MKCDNCGSTNIETDLSKGSTHCLNCGTVADDFNIVSDVAFDNTKVVGTFIAEHQNGSAFIKNKHGNFIGDSRQSRIKKAHQEIVSIGEKLCK